MRETILGITISLLAAACAFLVVFGFNWIGLNENLSILCGSLLCFFIMSEAA